MEVGAAALAVVVPCFKETGHILKTLESIPPYVNRIYCVDDGCPEHTGRYVEENCADPRVEVLYHELNQGVGAATLTGYRAALANDAEVIVKIDGDGQMDASLIQQFVTPISEQRADYVKGNRFFFLEDLEAMPRHRIFGNALLSFMSKFSTGYWRIFDPTNGFTAIHADALRQIPFHKVNRGYFFESDMLHRLATIRAVVHDMPHRAQYGSESSGLSLLRVVPEFTLRHARNFVARIFYNYFLRDFQLASVEWLAGPVLILFGLVFGGYQWLDHIERSVEASAGTVMLAGLPLIVGMQLLLSAIGFDVDNQPKDPVHLRGP